MLLVEHIACSFFFFKRHFRVALLPLLLVVSLCKFAPARELIITQYRAHYKGIPLYGIWCIAFLLMYNGIPDSA